MTVASYDQLAIFSAVAQERSFTRAAARLGMSQPALSRAMRQLEERLGVRLLARTTRRVSPTEAGEYLLRVIAPRFEEIANELAASSTSGISVGFRSVRASSKKLNSPISATAIGLCYSAGLPSLAIR
jgi:DNA-binding transcriptional LysR family regulator